MTSAKPNHRAARALLLQHLDLHPGKTVNTDLDPLEAGLVGNAAHAVGGDSYHLGEDQIRRSGHRYSVDESPRDRKGLDDNSSALDLGYFKVTTPRGTFDLYDYNRWLIGLCEHGDPDTLDLREVIYSPDGKAVRRFDRLKVRSTGDDSHLEHTHHSEFRDADGHRMIRLATRWLQHIGLIPDETPAPAKGPAPKPPSKPVPVVHEPGTRVLTMTSPPMTGADVEYLQRWVGASRTGKYDAGTRAEVIRYQRMQGLTPDGVAGAQTWTRILGRAVRL